MKNRLRAIRKRMDPKMLRRTQDSRVKGTRHFATRCDEVVECIDRSDKKEDNFTFHSNKETRCETLNGIS